MSLEDAPDILSVAFVGDLLDPLQHSLGPLFHLGSLHESQDENNLFLWGFETCNVIIERQVFLHFVHKSVGFASFTFEEGRVLAHGFDVCCCCDWLCHCSSSGRGYSSSWWPSSAWGSWRGSSGSSSLFSHCDIQEFFEFCFSEGVLWCDGSCLCHLGRHLGGSGHGGANDAL